MSHIWVFGISQKVTTKKWKHTTRLQFWALELVVNTKHSLGLQFLVFGLVKKKVWFVIIYNNFGKEKEEQIRPKKTKLVFYLYYKVLLCYIFISVVYYYVVWTIVVTLLRNPVFYDVGPTQILYTKFEDNFCMKSRFCVNLRMWENKLGMLFYSKSGCKQMKTNNAATVLSVGSFIEYGLKIWKEQGEETDDSHRCH